MPSDSSNDFYTPEADLERLAEMKKVDSDLPRALILGDSISIGYTPFVQALLRDRVAVLRPDANCGDTRRGLEKIDEWLGPDRWRVVHFNWGLHDLCYRHPESTVQGHRDKERGAIAVPLDLYEQNLDRLAARIKQSCDRAIWAPTTVVPEGEAGRFVEDAVRYNEVAQGIMEKHGIAIDDLYAVTKQFGPELFVGPGNVHFTEEGSRRLASQVAEHILAAVEDRSSTTSL